MDKVQAWLLTPEGVLFSRIVATLVKAGLVLLSARVPSLGLGPDTDRLVSELAPLVTVSAAVWWTKRQHDRSEARLASRLEQAARPERSAG